MEHHTNVGGVGQASGGALRTWALRIGTALVVLLLLLVGYALYRVGTPRDGSEEQPSPIAALEADSTYLEAARLQQTGDYADARAKYLEVLERASGPEQEGQVQYRIALAETFTDSASAVARLKGIVASAAYSDLLRAYAAQWLGLMLYRTSDSSVLPLIFTGDPYAAFSREGDVQLALRRLFEYASSFYPLAVAELEQAAWYAQGLKDADVVERATLADQYLPLIEEKLESGQADIDRTLSINEYKTFVTEALYLKAVVLARLSAAGFDYEYEPAMQEALNSTLLNWTPGDDSAIRYAYAMNLFFAEAGREEDARELLRPIVEDVDAYPAFKRMLVGEKDDVLGRKEWLVALAVSYPDFRTLLVSLGWPETAFAE